MSPGTAKLLDPTLYRQGHVISALNRWISLGVGALFFAFLWTRPGTPRVPTGLAAVVYALYNLAVLLISRNRRHAWSPALKITHNVVDALAVGLGSYLTGCLESPFWLLFYPHVVAVSVRGGLTYAMVMGVVDAGIVTILARLTPSQPLGGLHALALLWCAFMGGLMSSYLRRIREHLREANEELSAKNEELRANVVAHEVAQQEQGIAMARLRESEERYRRLLERIQEGVLIIQDARIVYANQVFADMTGDTPEGLLGADFRSLVPPADRKDLTERYRRWELSQAGAGELEARLQTRRGDTLVVSLRAGSVEFQGKRSVITTIRDITRERRMEQEVKGHAERLAAINEIANAVNLSLTIEDIFEVAADETRRLVPFDRLTIALLNEESSSLEVVAVGTGARRQRAAFDREAVAWAFRRPVAWCEGGDEEAPPYLQKLLAEPTIRSIATVPLLSKDRIIGSMNLGRLKPTPFSTWDLAVMEPVARHIAIALDNARLLEAVQQRSREFESLLEIGRGILERLELTEILPLVTRSVNRLMGTSYCILLLKQGAVLEVGAQEGLEPEVVEAFKGLRVGESLSGRVAWEGKPLFVADMGADPRLKYGQAVSRFGYRSYLCVPLKRGTEVLGTLEVVTKDTRLFSPAEQELMSAFADQAAVAMDNARLFQEARLHLARVTEANRRLEELAQLRQQYLRNVSHEFRTPLTVVKGYAEYVRDSPPATQKELQDVMKIVVESCDRVIDMVDTLIEVSRVEQGTPEEILQIQDLDLKELAVACVEALRISAEKRKIALDVDMPEGLTIRGDAGLLHQLLRKLLDNALKYSAPGAAVVVRGRGRGEELRLEVEDSGIGISPEHLPRIFEKFYMVDGGIGRRAGGAGVGLYLVREIVRLHGGSIDVQSLPGRGSLFAVRLPKEFQGRHPPKTSVLA